MNTTLSILVLVLGNLLVSFLRRKKVLKFTNYINALIYNILNSIVFWSAAYISSNTTFYVLAGIFTFILLLAIALLPFIMKKISKKLYVIVMHGKDEEELKKFLLSLNILNKYKYKL
jgi:hypothetical protein